MDVPTLSHILLDVAKVTLEETVLTKEEVVGGTFPPGQCRRNDAEEGEGVDEEAAGDGDLTPCLDFCVKRCKMKAHLNDFVDQFTHFGDIVVLIGLGPFVESYLHNETARVAVVTFSNV